MSRYIPLGIVSLNRHSKLTSLGKRVANSIKNKDEIQVLRTVTNTSTCLKG